MNSKAWILFAAILLLVICEDGFININNEIGRNPSTITFSDSSFIIMKTNENQTESFKSYFTFLGYNANGKKISSGIYSDELKINTYQAYSKGYSVTNGFELNEKFAFFIAVTYLSQSKPKTLKVLKASSDGSDINIEVIDTQTVEDTGFYNPAITLLQSSTNEAEIALVWENKTLTDNEYHLDAVYMKIGADNSIQSKVSFGSPDMSVKQENKLIPAIASTQNHLMIVYSFGYEYEPQYQKYPSLGSQLFTLNTGIPVYSPYFGGVLSGKIEYIQRIELKASGSLFACFASDDESGGFGFTYNTENQKTKMIGTVTQSLETESLINGNIADIEILDNENGDLMLFYQTQNDQTLEQKGVEGMHISIDETSNDYAQKQDSDFATFVQEREFYEFFLNNQVKLLANGGLIYVWEAEGEMVQYVRGMMEFKQSNCKVGEYFDKDEFDCFKCPNGTSTHTDGKIGIENCYCDKGYYFDDILDSCEMCTQNSYKNKVNNEECVECPTGKFFDGLGGTDILNCTDPVSNNLEVVIAVGIISGSLGIILFCIVGIILVGLILSLFIMLRKSRKKANRFDHIEGVDIILKEAEIEQNSFQNTVPKITVGESKHIIDFKEINVLTKIGQGGSNAVVYKADWKGINCAFKAFSEKSTIVYDLNNEQGRYDDFEKEVSFCVGLNHPSILQFYGASISPNRVGLIIQYCVNGDLNSFLTKYFISHDQKKYPKKEKLRIIKQIALGMEYLHSRKTIHRDLKPGNVLVDEHENAKIMDFGLSKFVENDEHTKTKRVGTVFYMSPEVIRGGNYGYSCDVYSFAIMMLVLITENFHPYGDIMESSIMRKVTDDALFRPEINEMEFKNIEFLIPIIKKCWDADPEERLTFSQLKDLIEQGIVKMQQK